MDNFHCGKFHYITVHHCFLFSIFNCVHISITSWESLVSKFPVSSSVRINLGEWMGAQTIAVRCACPPDISYPRLFILFTFRSSNTSGRTIFPFTVNVCMRLAYKCSFVYYGYTLTIHLLATENTLFQLYDNQLKSGKEIRNHKYV